MEKIRKMGSNYSKAEREEMLKRCKSRKNYIKQFVKATKALSNSHCSYLVSLRSITFSSPPPQISLSPPRMEDEEEVERWNFGGGNGEKFEDFDEIVKEIADYFVLAADSGSQVSFLLEHSNPNVSGKMYNCGRSLSPFTWTCGSKSKLYSYGEQVVAADATKCSVVSTNHFGTAQKLYVLEKNLYTEVKKCDAAKKEHENKVAKLKNLETLKKVDSVKIEKIKKEIMDLESTIRIAIETIDTISNEIIQLRELQLYPQLVQLVKGYGNMWTIMNKCHEAQMQKVQLCNSVKTTPSIQSIRQLKLGFNQWKTSLFNLIQSQKDYIQSLAGWLRLSLFSFEKRSSSYPSNESNIYLLCEKWRLATDLVPLALASEVMDNFLTVLAKIVIQQEEEENQKKKYKIVFKELEKKTAELRLLEKCDGTGQNLVAVRRTTVQSLLAKTEEEKDEYVKMIGITKAMILEYLQMGFRDAFQGITEFSSVCARELEPLCNYGIRLNESNDMGMIV